MTTRRELYRVIDRHFDGNRARDIAASLTDHYRSPGSRGYLEATKILERAFRDAGFDDLEISDYPVEDAWDPVDASLSLVEDDGERLLVDYETAPTCIAWWSDSTCSDGEELEVVDVGTGEAPADFEGKDLSGKVAFIHGTTRRPGWWEAARLAIDRGARGLITDYMLYQIPGIREPELVPDAVQLLRLPIRENSGVWAFSISHDAARRLKRRMAEGRAHVRARVNADSGPSVIRNLVVTLEGATKPSEYILYCAHSSGVKPGANCAEGPGLLVELARALGTAIDCGDIPRPQRSIRFLIGCEGAGIAGFLEDHADEIPGIHAALTYCSPGHRQDLTKSNLMLYRSPDSVPGYINDYLSALIDESPREADWIEKDGGLELGQVRFEEHFYTPWSDNGRFAAEGIQAPLFMSWPDRYFHSQLLTPEVIDPVVLRRAALVGGVAALELASAGAAEAERIARTVAAGARRRLAAQAMSATADTPEMARRVRPRIAHRLELELASLRRTIDLVPEAQREAAESEIARLSRELTADVERELASIPGSTLESLPASDASLIPVKTGSDRAPRWAGLQYSDLLEIAEILRAEDDNAGFNCLRVVADEVWAFTDGTRTVEDIAVAVGSEFDLQVAPAAVMRLLRGLEAAGYVEVPRVSGTGTKTE